jgi:putative hydrolase of the HAD superfamily
MPGIRAVLFDLGLTLVDFGSRPLEMLFDEGLRRSERILSDRGYAPPPRRAFYKRLAFALRMAYARTFVTWREMDTNAVIPRVLGGMGIEVPAELLGKMLDASYEPFGRNMRVLEGRRDMLEALAGRYRLGLVSNTVWPGRLHSQDLDRSPIGRYIEARVYSYDVGYRKPHSAPFQAALEALRVRPAEAVMVGDDIYSDVRGARRIGMRSILLGTGRGLRLWRPDARAARPAEVVETVRSWSSP